jgi:hypothetical protein
MKERGPLPIAVPSVHARDVYVIYDDGRPLVEAYDGPQIVGMDLRRRRSMLVKMAGDGKKLGTARIATARRGWPRRSGGRACTPGGAGGLLRLVLGGGRRTCWRRPTRRCT